MPTGDGITNDLLCEIRNDDGSVCSRTVVYRMRDGLHGWFNCCQFHFDEHTSNGDFSGFEYKAT